MAKPSRFDWFFRPQMADEDRPLSAELRFAEALAELPAIERSALALSEIGGLGADEIAQRLGTDAAVVRKVLTRARQTVRATIAARGRRSLSALAPLQSWWSSGSGAPVVRTAGAVAAAVIGTGVAIGGAAADPPRPPLVSPDPPVVRAIERPQQHHAGIAGAKPAPAAPGRAQQPRATAGPAAVRPESDRYGDIGPRPGHNAEPYVPARRASEPEIGSRPEPAPAAEPALATVPLAEESPPPPPLPFPTPYPVPVPLPTPTPAPVLPPVDTPVETPAVPAPPTLLPPPPSLPSLP